MMETKRPHKTFTATNIHMYVCWNTRKYPYSYVLECVEKVVYDSMNSKCNFVISKIFRLYVSHPVIRILNNMQSLCFFLSKNFWDRQWFLQALWYFQSSEIWIHILSYRNSSDHHRKTSNILSVTIIILSADETSFYSSPMFCLFLCLRWKVVRLRFIHSKNGGKHCFIVVQHNQILD